MPPLVSSTELDKINEINDLPPRQAVHACRESIRAVKRRMDSLRTSVAVAKNRGDNSAVHHLRAQVRELYVVYERFMAAMHHHERLRDKQELHEAWVLVVSTRYGALAAAECCAEAVRLCVTHGVSDGRKNSDRAEADPKPASEM